jgi:hypothetical protein
MKAAVGREKYLSGSLAIMVLILVGVLAWEWDQGMRLKQDLTRFLKIPVTALPEQKILPEFALPDKTTGLPEWLSRPIFSPIRRPPAAKVAAVTMKKGQFLLVGVLITPQKRAALLRDVQTNKTQTVVMGAMVRGLTLGEVAPAQVVLRQGGDSEDLVLHVQRGAAGATVRPNPVPAPSPIVAPSQGAPDSSAHSALPSMAPPPALPPFVGRSQTTAAPKAPPPIAGVKK